MKIALIAQPADYVGSCADEASSVAIITRQLATRFAREHEVTIFARRAPGQAGFETDWAGVRIRRLRACRRLHEAWVRVGDLLELRPPPFSSPWYYRGYFRQVARALRDDPPDVVHLHGLVQHAPLLRGALPRARIVLHMHGTSLMELERSALEGPLSSVDRIVGVSDYVTSGIRRRFPALAERCATVPNGVDTERFRPGRCGPPDARPVKRLLYAGRISPEKGIHLLLEAFAEIARKREDCELELVGTPGLLPLAYVVGPSREPAVRALRRFYGGGALDRLRRQLGAGGDRYLADALAALPPGVARRVRRRAAVAHAALPDLYRAADLFVFPSVCDEAGCMPPLEAMASAVPVVATRGGSIPEIIHDGETGLLVERPDSRALARALETLLDDEGLARRLAAAGPGATAHYSWGRVASRMLEVYGS